MFHTRNCKELHRYLNNDEYDVERLKRMLIELIGYDNYEKSKATLEEHFGKKITAFRDYFALIDAMGTELYHLGDPSSGFFQRQEAFIFSNNFIHDNEAPAKIYVSRLLNFIPDLLRGIMKMRRDEI
mmetsp:Transcript_4276/g.3112  ORF Transcript_4276/g.3112 Transcript_4276/m.3112 type:complete len:127 (+) Transcript_4276:331-711(+)